MRLCDQKTLPTLAYIIYICVPKDLDECSDPADNDCEQTCNNRVGGYYCTCEAGYTLHIDQKNCDGEWVEDYNGGEGTVGGLGDIKTFRDSHADHIHVC